MKFYQKILSAGAVAGAVAVSVLTSGNSSISSPSPENLTRGLCVAELPEGNLITWRSLPDDPVAYTLYRDGKLIASIDGTSYLDTAATRGSVYAIDDNQVEFTFDNTFDGYPYKKLTLRLPDPQTMPDGTKCTYTPNDASVADLDGDGQYEIILKWDPTNSKDNSLKGYTGTVFIDAYKLDGTFMWRIDLGKNIRAGAHYTQFQAFDYDGDGKAEVIMKTADGTVDGTGKPIGNRSKDYRNKDGMVISGPEYLTLFRGTDGKALSTVSYTPPRTVQQMSNSKAAGSWGDKNGNRSERYLAATAYLGGEHHSAIFARGYYTAAYVAAYDVENNELKLRWLHKSETPWVGLYGQGNHSVAVGDIDGDGLDEIVYGAAALNHDGSFRYSTGYGHGDAHHLADLNPDLPGLEFWTVHETSAAKYTDELRAPDGSVIWGDPQPYPAVDNGRGMAADLDSNYRGYEVWSNKSNGLRSIKGEYLATPKISTNFRVYIDSDIQDELFDGAVITKYNSLTRRIDTLFNGSKYGLAGNNGTKNTPCLVADLFGDWREEIVLRSEKEPDALYIIGTKEPTKYRVNSLMTDHTYRMGIAAQNTGYNQPPHLGYFLPDLVGK